MRDAFEEYLSYKKEMDYYNHILAVMNWDFRVNAPKASFSQKLDTMKYFNGKLFSLETDQNYGAVLLKLEKNISSFDEAKALTINRQLKEYRRKSRVPSDFMEEFTLLKGQCEKSWEEAKKANDYELFAPWLQKNIELSKRYFSFLEPDQDPYDTMLENWQGGLKADQIEKLFSDLRIGISPKVKEAIQTEKKTYRVEELKASKETMEKVQNYLLDYIGFDRSRGAIGITPHALTSRIDSNDIRITNQLVGRNPIDVCFSTIHEGGHGIYHQNVDPNYEKLAPGDLIYSDIHESQSRFYENILGRNIAFWKPIYTDLCKLWPELGEYSLEDIDEYINRLEASEIRTSADELTYCMHILLRFEMEMAMFRRNVSVHELKEMWNELTKEMLGFVPTSDSTGILQDMHWSSVFLGYFPTYLLGSIYDGIFLQQMEKELGCCSKLLADGNIGRITKWLNDNIHVHGSLYDGPQLIRKVCHCELSTEPLVTYFMNK